MCAEEGKTESKTIMHIVLTVLESLAKAIIYNQQRLDNNE